MGKKLVTFLEDMAKEDMAKAHQAAIVDLTSSLTRADDGVHKFYKGLGYKNEGPRAKLYLRKKL